MHLSTSCARAVQLGVALGVLLIGLLSTAPPVAADCPGDCLPGMVSHWTFDETSGTIACDCCGTSDGNVAGATWTTGLVGGALEFTSGDYVFVPVTSALNITGAVSVEAWIRKPPGAGSILMASDPSFVSFLLYVQSPPAANNAAAFQCQHSGTTRVFGTTDVSDGEWHHVVGVRDPVMNELRIYVDGQLENTSSPSYSNVVTRMNIGQYSYWGALPYVGQIDEVVIWNIALTDEQVLERYEAVMGSPESEPEATARLRVTECAQDEEGRIALTIANTGLAAAPGTLRVIAGLSYHTAWVPESMTWYWDTEIGPVVVPARGSIVVTFEVPAPPEETVATLQERLEQIWTAAVDLDPEHDYIGLIVSIGELRCFGFLPLPPP